MRVYRGELHDSSPPADRAWVLRANCTSANPAIFFPDQGVTPHAAYAICHTCDVRTECLEYALTYHERHGVWGGKSERERRKILRGRRVA